MTDKIYYDKLEAANFCEADILLKQRSDQASKTSPDHVTLANTQNMQISPKWSTHIAMTIGSLQTLTITILRPTVFKAIRRTIAIFHLGDATLSLCMVSPADGFCPFLQAVRQAAVLWGDAGISAGCLEQLEEAGLEPEASFAHLLRLYLSLVAAGTGLGRAGPPESACTILLGHLQQDAM